MVLRSVFFFLLVYLTPDLLRAELNTVAAVRGLTQEQARGGLAVRLRGTITYFRGEAGQAFIQDATGSIFFHCGASHLPGAVTAGQGDVVEITGFTMAGLFSPSVAGGVAKEGTPLPVQLRGTGKKNTPLAEFLDLREIRQTRWHDQLVRVRGTVRESLKAEAGDAKGHLLPRLLISDRAGQVTEAQVQGIVPDDWLDREVEFIAIVAGGSNERGQFVNVRLLIPDLAQVSLLPPPLASISLPISELFLYQPQLSAWVDEVPRWTVQGVVTLVQQGRGFYITDGKSGLQVQSPQRIDLGIGDRVQVAGYPTRGQRGTFLEDGVVRRLGSGPPPPPLWQTWEEAARLSSEAALTTLTGNVEAVAQTTEGLAIYLADSRGRAFQARLPTAFLAQRPAVGALVRVTGICQPASAEPASPSPLLLLLRQPKDLEVLRDGPWLTSERLGWLLAGFACLLGTGLLWLVILKRQVTRQTRQIMAGVVECTLLEERQRLGRDLHDSLEQQLAGLHLHLEALDYWTEEDPSIAPRIRQSIGTAGRMLSHCRSEARRSVHNLRSGLLDAGGLPGALEGLAAGPHPTGSPVISLKVDGLVHSLPQLVEFHLLRCAQESVGNALKHAAAQNISLLLAYTSNQILLVVRDDGVGFDPAVLPSASSGEHFGLLHLQERVTRLQGILDLRSTPGTGTVLTFTIPLPL